MQDGSSKLLAVKVIHTLIWIAMVAVILYVDWSGFTNNISVYSWSAVGVIVIEGLVLLLFKGHCPLTYIARKYSDSQKSNFDIFLPEWLARYNKEIFTTLFVAGLIGMILNSF